MRHPTQLPQARLARFGCALAAAWPALLLLMTDASLWADGAREIAELKQQIEQFQNKARYPEAVRAARQLLALTEDQCGAEQGETAAALEMLGHLYYLRPDFGDEEQPWLRSLVIREKLFGPDHVETAASLLKLGIFYRDRGDGLRAGEYLRRARRIYEATEAPLPRKRAEVLNALGWLYMNTLDTSKAEGVLQESLAEFKRSGLPEDATLADTYMALTWVYSDIDSPKAERICREALRIQESVLGPENPFTAGAMIALATLLHNSGRSAAAEPLYRRGMEIQRNALGEEHSATIKTLNSLGGFYLECGNPAAAEPILRAALGGIERSKGQQHPDLIYNLHWLANLAHQRGDLSEAERLEERAVAIGEKAHVKTRGETLWSLRHLACLKLETGQADEGCALAIRSQQLFEKALSESLSFTSESERLQDHSSQDGLSLLASAGLAGPLTAAVLHTKGIVLDSMLEDRAAAEASATTEARDLLRQLQTGKSEAAQNLADAAIAQSSSAPKTKVDEVTNQRVADAESNLARYHAGLGRARRAFCITVEQVQGALPVDAVLIEVLRYGQYLGTNRWEPCYGAILLSSQGAPIWIPLGAAAQLEGLVKRYQHALRGQGEQSELTRVLECLSTQLWAPLASHLPAGTRQVIISPDGELNFVSFATLLTSEKRFVGEAVSISYVAAGRDLLSPAEPARAAADLEVWANPDFGAELPLVASTPPSRPTHRSIMVRELRDWNFTPLPGAEDEGKLLQSHASELGFDQVGLHLVKDATEAELRRVQAPYVLHLATHGFILPETSSGGESGHAARRLNPMRRSGLALAGAQRTLAAWAHGCAPPAENDGIVTAEEVGSLNLHGTWLVAVAACDSGAGQAQAGEGVLGLRRGFMQAGTRNLLLALWPIDDAQTAPFISEFYAAAHKEHSATAALSEVQRRWLRRLRVERGLAEACQVAGPYILSFQGHDQRP